MSALSSKLGPQDPARASGADTAGRYVPTQAYRPRRRPQTVEDQDACALYAAVRRDGKANLDVIE